MIVCRRALLKPHVWVEHVRDWFPDQVTAAGVHARPGEYICCFSFFDVGEHVDIDPTQQLDLLRQRGAQRGAAVRALAPPQLAGPLQPDTGGLAETTSPYHASGHISGKELRELIYQIGLQRVIPIHTGTPKRSAEILYSDMDVRVPDMGVSIGLVQWTKVNAFVAVTDKDWFDLLSRTPGLDEVNFWQPSADHAFKALRVGELFLFKLHSPLDYIVGGGLFSHWTGIPVSYVWEAFGVKNGTFSLLEMRSRIKRYRRTKPTPHEDYNIGCILLAAVLLPP